jgi:hypothetical protein
MVYKMQGSVSLWKNGFVPFCPHEISYQVLPGSVPKPFETKLASMVSWKPHRSLGICLAPAPFHKATKMGNAGASWKSLAWARSEVQGPGADVSKMAIPGPYIWNILEPDAHTHRSYTYIFVSTSHMCQKCVFSAHGKRVPFSWQEEEDFDDTASWQSWRSALSSGSSGSSG